MSELFNHVLGNWRLVTSALLVLNVTLVVVQTLYAWYRLRHIKGPLLAGFSKLWLIRAVSGGNMHWEFAKVCEQYGKVPYRCERDMVGFCIENINGLIDYTGSLARIGPNHLVTSDPNQMRRMLGVRSLYTRSEWYIGMKFDPSHENVESERNEERHTELRAKMAAGVSFWRF